MPSYSFECTKCGHKFDQTLSIAQYLKQESAGFKCPKCKSKKVEQVVVGCTVQTSKKS